MSIDPSIELQLELRNLQYNLMRLNTFLLTDAKKELPIKEQQLLSDQFHFMKLYEQTLQDRIDIYCQKANTK